MASLARLWSTEPVADAPHRHRRRSCEGFAVEKAEPGTRYLLMTGKPLGEVPRFNGPVRRLDVRA
jgi:hypothetical protein